MAQGEVVYPRTISPEPKQFTTAYEKFSTLLEVMIYRGMRLKYTS